MKERICRTPDITHDQWLAYRRTGIGGSDAGTIVGLNPYSSRYYLYCDKMGQLAEKEDSEAMRQGRDLEQYVADRWMEATGKKCRRNNYMWRSTQHPFMLADIDREVIGENAGLECKTTSVYNKHDLAGGEIPPAYYVQCQHYMAVMGFDCMYLAVLVLNKGFYHFRIERDDTDIAVLIDAERSFWHNNILLRCPPALDGSDADFAAVRQRYPDNDTDDALVPLGSKGKRDLDLMTELHEEIRQLQQEADACKARIMCQLKSAPGGLCDSWQVSWKTQTTTRLDADKLKRLHPQVYADCIKKTSARVFRAKKIKED